MSFEQIRTSDAYARLKTHIKPEDVTKTARQSLLERLRKHRDLKSSAAWYLSEQQTLEFASYMFDEEKRQGSNASRELTLIDRLFSRADLFQSTPKINRAAEKAHTQFIAETLKKDLLDQYCRVNLIDLGPGNGQKARRVIAGTQKLLPARETLYFPIDASQYMNAFALANIGQLPTRGQVHCYDVERFAKSVKPISDAQRKQLRAMTKHLTDIVWTMSAQAGAASKLDQISAETAARGGIERHITDVATHFRQYFEQSMLHKYYSGKLGIALSDETLKTLAKEHHEYGRAVQLFLHATNIEDMIDCYCFEGKKKPGPGLPDLMSDHPTYARLVDAILANITPEKLARYARVFQKPVTANEAAVSLFRLHAIGANLDALRQSGLYSTYDNLNLGCHIKPERIPALARKLEEDAQRIGMYGGLLWKAEQMHEHPSGALSAIKTIAASRLITAVNKTAEALTSELGPSTIRHHLHSIAATLDGSPDRVYADTKGIHADFISGDLAPVMNTVRALASDPTSFNIVALLGQTLGNFSRDERTEVLRGIYTSMNWGDYLLLGVELRPDSQLSQAAQDKSIETIKQNYRGPHAEAFARASLDLLGIDHKHVRLREPAYEDDTIKLDLDVTADFTLANGREQLRFKKGEQIPFAESHKFDLEKLVTLANTIGFSEKHIEVYTTPYQRQNGECIAGGSEYSLLLLRKGSSQSDILWRRHWNLGEQWKFGEYSNEAFYFENTGPAETHDMRDIGGLPITYDSNDRMYFILDLKGQEGERSIQQQIIKDGYQLEHIMEVPFAEIPGIADQSYIVHARKK